MTSLLQHRAKVDSYLLRREAEAAAVRLEAESRSPSAGLRQKLRARIGA